MYYLYHSVPERQQGTILYPLNQLKEMYPESYVYQVKKYVGREGTMKQRIPILDCLWNDVLHFTAVDPRNLKLALLDAGLNPISSRKHYQIDPKMLVADNAVVYLYSQREYNEEISEEDFVSYNPAGVSNIAVIPQATKEYYKEIIASGKRPLRYHGVPHVLYRGTIDTSSLDIITV